MNLRLRCCELVEAVNLRLRCCELVVHFVVNFRCELELALRCELSASFGDELPSLMNFLQCELRSVMSEMK